MRDIFRESVGRAVSEARRLDGPDESERDETKRSEVSAAAEGWLPHMGRPMTGWTVGMLCEDEASQRAGRRLAEPLEGGRTHCVRIAHLGAAYLLRFSSPSANNTDEERGRRTFAHAITPPLTTMLGLTPKYAGCHRTRSASLPTLTSPITCDMPCTMAGLIVYLAM